MARLPTSIGKTFGRGGLGRELLAEGVKDYLAGMFDIDMKTNYKQIVLKHAILNTGSSLFLDRSKENVDNNILGLSGIFKRSVEQINTISQNVNFDRNQQILEQKVERLDLGQEPSILFRKIDSNISLVDSKIDILSNRMVINRGITDAHTSLINQTSIVLGQISEELLKQKTLNLENRMEGDASRVDTGGITTDQFYKLLKDSGIDKQLDNMNSSIADMETAIQNLNQKIDKYDVLDYGRTLSHAFEGLLEKGSGSHFLARSLGSLFVGGFAGTSEYLNTGDVGQSLSVGGGASAGAWGGAWGGAQIGSFLGPWGTAAGAALGGLFGAVGGETLSRNLYQRFIGESEDNGTVMTPEGFTRSEEQVKLEESATAGVLSLQYNQVSLRSVSTFDISADILSLNGRKILLNGIDITAQDSLTGSSGSDDLRGSLGSDYLGGGTTDIPRAGGAPGRYPGRPTRNNTPETPKITEEQRSVIDQIASGKTLTGDSMAGLEKLSSEELRTHGINVRYSPRDGTPIYSTTGISQEDVIAKASQTAGEGTYRPIYKLSDIDLSDDVINTIAGEAIPGNQESVDGVINNMFNRVGVQNNWRNLHDIARAPDQYAGYKRASPEEAEFIKERIKAIASGSVPSNIGRATEFRAAYYVHGKGKGKTFERQARAQGYLQPSHGDNIYAETFAPGQYAPYDEPKFKTGDTEPSQEELARAYENLWKEKFFSPLEKRLAKVEDGQQPQQNIDYGDGIAMLPVAGSMSGKSILEDSDVPFSGGSPGSRSFGGNRRGHTRHTGVDIPGKPGDPIIAVMDGVIRNPRKSSSGYGWIVDIEYPDGTIHRAAHLGTNAGGRSSAIPDEIMDGTPVKKGDVIGYLGYSGNAGPGFPHTHYEVINKDYYEEHAGLPPGRESSMASLESGRQDPREWFRHHAEEQQRLAEQERKLEEQRQPSVEVQTPKPETAQNDTSSELAKLSQTVDTPKPESTVVPIVVPQQPQQVNTGEPSLDIQRLKQEAHALSRKAATFKNSARKSDAGVDDEIGDSFEEALL